MLQSRALQYFDEVARRGSIRRASDHLNIAASAVDRQILQLEDFIGSPLFERTPKGLLLTSAGELLLDSVRRSKRDFAKAKSYIDDLQGLRRGEVSIVTVEGALSLVEEAIAGFHERFPAIRFRTMVLGAIAAAELVISNEYDLGLVFAAPKTNALRVEKELFYQLGVAAVPDHPIFNAPDINIYECNNYPLILPDDSISLRNVIDSAWKSVSGESPRPAFEANNLAILRSLATKGCGIAPVTEVCVLEDVASGRLKFVPLPKEKTPISVLSLITASGRSLSTPASLFISHLGEQMMLQGNSSI